MGFHMVTGFIDCTAHQCTFPGCNQALVLDGNMKNRRDICAATEAGFIEYEGLPGTIKTGCQSSPLQTSKYCYYHAPRMSQCDPEEDQGTTTTSSTIQEGIVKCIMGKKITRNNTYYQVSYDLSTLLNPLGKQHFAC